MPRLLCSPGKDLVPIVQKAGWAPGRVWTGAENLAPTGIRSPDCPAHSQLLYRLTYLAHDNIDKAKKLLTHIHSLPNKCVIFSVYLKTLR
jgi:hypothetical protein